MKPEPKPRAHDHLVEPMYQALREEDSARDVGAAPAREGAGDWRKRILWLLLGALAIGYIVWRQAF
jgi:hypothetical protein